MRGDSDNKGLREETNVRDANGKQDDNNVGSKAKLARRWVS